MTRGTFVVESFIDELAANAKQDPLAYRLALLDKNPRAKAVLQIAAEQVRMGQAAAGRARAAGLRSASASAASSRRSFKSASTRKARSSRRMSGASSIAASQVNPDTIRAQMESGIVFGLSAALYGEITIKDGRVEQTNFGDYRVLRINEAPQIDVHLVKSLEAPGGIGEPGTSCVMPALTNAIYAATRQTDSQAAGRRSVAEYRHVSLIETRTIASASSSAPRYLVESSFES